MKILSNLSKEALKLSHLAQRQDMTVTEASRHLQRLNDADLISKDVKNLYKITPYGRLILSLLPTLGSCLKIGCISKNMTLRYYLRSL
jgi:predicted transcriptional regulator